MKTKMIFVLLSLPLVLVSFTKAGKANGLNHKTSSNCDTASVYSTLVLKQAALNLQTPRAPLAFINQYDDSRAKLQMKAYLDSLIIEGNPAALTGVKKEVKIKNAGQPKRGANNQKTNNLSRSANRVNNSGNGIPSDQFPVLFDPDDTNPPVAGTRNK